MHIQIYKYTNAFICLYKFDSWSHYSLPRRINKLLFSRAKKSIQAADFQVFLSRNFGSTTKRAENP